MLLNHCLFQVDEYSFKLTDITPTESYDDAGVDRTSFTNVILTFRKVNDTASELTLDISDRFLYLYDNTGLVINFTDFEVDTFNGYAYFPDYLYESNISYTYNGTEYESDYSRGFHTLISRVVYQQTQQSDWLKTLACSCDCMKHSSILRKWHFMELMVTAAELCLVNEWLRMLEALYKICGVEHEFGTDLI
jgi:hypothetical protein